MPRSPKPPADPKPGRPALMQGGRRVQVYLDARSVEGARRLGDGNVSIGIRRALKRAAEHPNEKP